MPLSSPFRVTAISRSTRANLRHFGQVLLLARAAGPFDQDSSDKSENRLALYNSLDDLTDTWASDTSVHEAASVYFGQGASVPPLYVGLWDNRADIDSVEAGNRTEAVTTALAQMNVINPRLYLSLIHISEPTRPY